MVAKLFMFFVVCFFSVDALYAQTIRRVARDGSQPHRSINGAVGVSEPGDIILVMDNERYEERVEIIGRRDLIIRSASFYNQVINGDRRWPTAMPTIQFRDTERLRPYDAADAADNPDEVDYDRNGAIFIYNSQNITIEGFNINGVSIYLAWRHVWGGANLFGNNAVMIHNSRAVTIRGCDIRNAYRGIHFKDRNIQGIFTEANPDDLDVDQFSPGGLPLAMGNHLIEMNRIRDNHWGVMPEILWDAGSTIRNNLIYRNGLKDWTIAPYFAYTGEFEPAMWWGGAFKIHGVQYPSLVIHNNTFWRNGDIFNGHWQVGGPNFRIFNNLFAERDPALLNHADVFGDELLLSRALTPNRDLGPGLSSTTGFDRLFASYGPFLRHNAFQTQLSETRRHATGIWGRVPNFYFEQGGLVPTDPVVRANYYHLRLGGVERVNIAENRNIFVHSGFFRSESETDENFLVPDANRSSVNRGLVDGGDGQAGVYDYDGSVADIGAFMPNGQWAGYGNFLVLFDRDRYAVVNFFQDEFGRESSQAEIRFFLEYNGTSRLTNLEFNLQRYQNRIESRTFQDPQEFDITPLEHYLQNPERRADILQRLNNGERVEIRYVGLAPQFSRETDGYYARFMLQLRGTDEQGNSFSSNEGYFDYRKTPYSFVVSLFDWDYSQGINQMGAEFEFEHSIFVDVPFWARVQTLDEQGRPRDMRMFNNGGILVSPETVPGQLWQWVDNSGDGVIQNEEWQRISELIERGSSRWNDYGVYEGVFRITAPSRGLEVLRVNLRGADAMESAMSGTSVGFYVLGVADRIEITRPETRDGVWSPESGQRETLEVMVYDVNGNFLVDQLVQLTIEGTPDIGRIISNLGEEVSYIWIRTGMDGVARVDFVVTEEGGISGRIDANTTGGVDPETGDTLILNDYIRVVPTLVDPNQSRLVPNVLGRDNLIRDDVTGGNAVALDPESFDHTVVNGIIVNYPGDPASNDWGDIGLGLFDIRIQTPLDVTSEDPISVTIIVTNSHGNVVRVVRPMSADGNVYRINQERQSEGQGLEIVQEPSAEFLEPGVITKPQGMDIRIAVPWNHVNDKGRLAEKGVFFVIFEIEAKGRIVREQSKFIVR